MVKLFILVLGLPIVASSQASLSLKLSNYKGESSCIGVALYSEEDFLIEEKALLTDYFCNNGDANNRWYTIGGSIPTGSYALAVFEDINKNKKLDKNLTGIPIEPYVFSNNAGSKWRKPIFQDASFELTSGNKELFLELKYWKEY